MSTPAALAVIDGLCARPLPGPRAVAQDAAPRYHLAELPTAEGGPCVLRAAAEEQCEAERDALAALLERRWGAPDRWGLGGVLLRALEHGEDIPEPWASLSARVPDVALWHTDGRWVALGVARLDPDTAPGLLAVVTDVDPP
jgi:hypothetical protein